MLLEALAGLLRGRLERGRMLCPEAAALEPGRATGRPGLQTVQGRLQQLLEALRTDAQSGTRLLDPTGAGQGLQDDVQPLLGLLGALQWLDVLRPTEPSSLHGWLLAARAGAGRCRVPCPGLLENAPAELLTVSLPGH